jgi:prepilin peptidase CpaA
LTDPLLLGRAVLVLACAAACWLDARHRVLPNWLSLATLVSGLGFALAGAHYNAQAFVSGYGGLAALGSHAAHAALALVAGAALFAIGIIGGGDAKFYAAVAAWFRLAEGLRLLVYVSLAGFGLILAWFLIRRLRGIPVQRRAQDDAGKFPYGVAIAAGAVLATFA